MKTRHILPAVVRQFDREEQHGAAALPPPKLSVMQAASHLGVSKSWLDKKRITGGAGPPYLKLGRRVVYDLYELEAWAATNRRHHTSEAL
jgi:hypothetical protein